MGFVGHSTVKSKKVDASPYWIYANNFTYNPAGVVTSMELGNLNWESTTFNERLQPTQIALGKTVSATDLLKLDYGFGTSANNGNVASQTITVKRSGQSDLVFDQTYTYDSLNRIRIAEEKTGSTTNWKQTFIFDRYGNRNFDRSNTTQPTSFSNPSVSDPTVNTGNNRFASGQGWVYDAAGNVITDAEGRTFTYDAENKQIEAKNSSAATLGTYYFDGDGKRVKKVVPSTGETTIFVYDAGGKMVAEYSTNLSSTPQIQYLTNDNLGTPRIITNALGIINSRTDYMPYGEEIIGLGGRSSTDKYVADDVRQGFTGYENDEETGLDFAQARMYINNLGRFLSSDPLLTSGRSESPQTWNRYVYVLNNPLVLVDPDGLYECTAGKEKCAKLDAAVEKAVAAMKQYDPKSKEYKALNRALKAYWDFKNGKSKSGVKDGLKVKQGKDSEMQSEAKVEAPLERRSRGNVTISLTIKKLEIHLRSDVWDKDYLPGIIANEGANVQDARDAVANKKQNSQWDEEYRSLEAEAFVLEKLFPDKPLDYPTGRVYDPSWAKLAKTDRDANRDKAITQILHSPKGYNLPLPKRKP